MKALWRIPFLFLVFVVFCPGFLVPVQAAEPSVPIAVIDVQALLGKSGAAKSLQTQLKARQEAFQKEFGDLEASLQKKEKSLAAERASLSPEDFGKKKKAFENDLLNARKAVQKSKRALDEGVADAVGRIRSRIILIATDLAKERGYRIVMTRENLVVVDKAMDITDDVMTRMNKVLPDVKLKVSSK